MCFSVDKKNTNQSASVSVEAVQVCFNPDITKGRQKQRDQAETQLPKDDTEEPSSDVASPTSRSPMKSDKIVEMLLEDVRLLILTLYS